MALNGNEYRGLRVLVAGGFGFLGSNLTRRLVDLGADVVVVDGLKPDYGGISVNLRGYDDKVRICVSDLRNVPAIRPLLADRDIVFNLAGQVSHMSSMTDPVNDIELNVVGCAALLEHAEARPLRRGSYTLRPGRSTAGRAISPSTRIIRSIQWRQ